MNKSGCFSQCGNGPMVVVYPDDVWYGGVTREKARRIAEEHLAGGRPVEDLRYQAPPGPNKNPRRMAEIEAARAPGGGVSGANDPPPTGSPRGD